MVEALSSKQPEVITAPGVVDTAALHAARTDESQSSEDKIIELSILASWLASAVHLLNGGDTNEDLSSIGREAIFNRALTI